MKQSFVYSKIHAAKVHVGLRREGFQRKGSNSNIGVFSPFFPENKVYGDMMIFPEFLKQIDERREQ